MRSASDHHLSHQTTRRHHFLNTTVYTNLGSDILTVQIHQLRCVSLWIEPVGTVWLAEQLRIRTLKQGDLVATELVDLDG